MLSFSVLFFLRERNRFLLSKFREDMHEINAVQLVLWSLVPSLELQIQLIEKNCFASCLPLENEYAFPPVFGKWQMLI
jgi:hypothetical protein